MRTSIVRRLEWVCSSTLLGLLALQGLAQAPTSPAVPPTPPAFPRPGPPPLPGITNRNTALAAARTNRPSTPPVVASAPIPAPVPPIVPQAGLPAPTGTTTPPEAIVWDTEFKEQKATSGDTNAVIVFWLTNVHTAEVVINSVRPSCGCTVAKLPAQPWHIKPGESGPIEANLDLRGKSGTLTKSLYVDTSSGPKSLLFKVTVADHTGAISMSDPDRLKNVQLAMADRQVVFKNAECSKCHAEPGHGKWGAPLYQAACAICHETSHRATMVPDLKALKHPTTPEFWRTWIKYGRAGSLMPAFAKSEGGPLTEEQVESLVGYLSRTMPGAAQPASTPNKPAPGTSASIKSPGLGSVSPIVTPAQ